MRLLRSDTDLDRIDEVLGVAEYYRDLLAEPAVFPWEGGKYEPVRIGPTWQTTDDGHWLLPDHTLGWWGLGWSGVWLQHKHKPWRHTLEQARFLLWWYAVDDAGEFLYQDAVLQRLKGWGKDPMGATVLSIEALGPARFAGFTDEWPYVGATDVEDAWCQTAAVSLEQTKNTMRLFPGLITPDARRRYGIPSIGKELIHADSDRRMIQAVTSSPATLEGARSTVVLLNETHLWDSSNQGHDMYDVIERNSAKSEDGAARTLKITNAFEPSGDSVGQRDREAYDKIASGEFSDGATGILYDSLEAPPEAPLTAEAAPHVVRAIRGDSVWLSPTRIVKSILDPRNPPSRSRRWWYNQVTAAEDAWADPMDVDAATRDLPEKPGDEWAAFFDGSKSDDSTGYMRCRLSDGHQVTVAVWQKPAGERGKTWTVPRKKVDKAVRADLQSHKVVAFFADPSHAKQEDGTGYWDQVIDGWHRDFGKKFKVWPVKSGNRRHSVLWDMSDQAHLKQFTEAAEEYAEALANGEITHDGHPALRQHMKNARRAPNRFGVGMAKEHRESARKIDLAVCAVGARMVRRIVLNSRRSRGGKVIGV